MLKSATCIIPGKVMNCWTTKPTAASIASWIRGANLCESFLKSLMDRSLHFLHILLGFLVL